MAVSRAKRVKTIGAYLKALPADQRASLQRVRKAILATCPDAEEVISYGMPAFKWNGMLLYMAASKNHCAVYGAISRVVAADRAFYAKYVTSKGTLRFTPEKPLPLALIRKLVKGRMAENVRRVGG
jgi:uncharacterized protein YdhG (YjbR/CyaY superfamily)